MQYFPLQFLSLIHRAVECRHANFQLLHCGHIVCQMCAITIHLVRIEGLFHHTVYIPFPLNYSIAHSSHVLVQLHRRTLGCFSLLLIQPVRKLRYSHLHIHKYIHRLIQCLAIYLRLFVQYAF